MKMKLSQIRALVREAVLAEEELAAPTEPQEEIEDADVEEMTTVASIGIMGYPTPGPFGPLNMLPPRRVKRKRLKRPWTGAVGKLR